MNFQNQWAWLGALALALPIAVHLFSKRPARTIAFPSLRFVALARVLPSRRTRLSDLLLLTLRLAVIAAAVVALTQPLFNVSPSATTVARAVVLDTSPSSRDSAARAVARDSARRLATTADAGMVVETASPRDVLRGASAWLSTHAGPTELFVLSDFQRDIVDSMSLARVPNDITLHLLRVASTRTRASGLDSSGDGRVRWITSAGVDEQSVVARAVRASGGRALASGNAVGAQSSAREIVVSVIDNDSVVAWLQPTRAQAPRTLTAPWMGDALVQLHRDTLLSASALEIAARDTLIAAPFTIVTRNRDGAPVVLATSIRSADSTARLLIVLRAPTQLLVAATLLAASQAVAPWPFTTDSTTLSDAQLRALEQFPRANPAALARAADVVRTSDYQTGESQARYLWLFALVLLGVEVLVRRRIQLAAVTVNSAS